MAFIQINMMSENLLRTVNVNAIVPVDKIQMPDKEKKDVIIPKKFKTLYLLHGIFGSQVDWVNNTKLQLWAEERNVVIIMPSGENRFYIDYPLIKENYGKFIGEELVKITRHLFPLSDKKEDTFIGGLSMGGYGALRNGLKYHDTFGSIIALSAGDIPRSSADAVLPYMDDRFIKTLFGDEQQIINNDNDIKTLVINNAINNKNHQRVFIACGTEDSLLDKNKEYYKLLKDNNYDVDFKQSKGKHDWDFWNEYIYHALNWLPLGEKSKGLSSGHIK